VSLIGRICSRYCDCLKVSNIEQVESDPTLTPAERATYARQLAQNPVWNELIRNLKADAFTFWEKTGYQDVEGREFLWKQAKVIELIELRVRGYLSNAVLNENLEERRLKKAATPRDGRKLREE